VDCLLLVYVSDLYVLWRVCGVTLFVLGWVCVLCVLGLYVLWRFCIRMPTGFLPLWLTLVVFFVLCVEFVVVRWVCGDLYGSYASCFACFV